MLLGQLSSTGFPSSAVGRVMNPAFNLRTGVQIADRGGEEEYLGFLHVAPVEFL